MVIFGHILSVDSVKADPTKVEVVCHWATPTSCFKVWCFVGLAKYFLLYIKRFGVLAALLSSLTRPWATFHQWDSAQHSF